METIKLSIHTIGDNGLLGAVVNHFGFDNVAEDLKDKIYIFRYAEVTCDADSLVSQVSWLYKHGAADVQLTVQPGINGVQPFQTR